MATDRASSPGWLAGWRAHVTRRQPPPRPRFRESSRRRRRLNPCLPASLAHRSRKGKRKTCATPRRAAPRALLGRVRVSPAGGGPYPPAPPNHSSPHARWRGWGWSLVKARAHGHPSPPLPAAAPYASSRRGRPPRRRGPAAGRRVRTRFSLILPVPGRAPTIRDLRVETTRGRVVVGLVARASRILAEPVATDPVVLPSLSAFGSVG